MRINVGSTERIIRVVLGLVIGILGIVFQSFWGLIGVIPLVSGLSGFCPLYGVFGISTCQVPNENASI